MEDVKALDGPKINHEGMAEHYKQEMEKFKRWWHESQEQLRQAIPYKVAFETLVKELKSK